MCEYVPLVAMVDLFECIHAAVAEIDNQLLVGLRIQGGPFWSRLPALICHKTRSEAKSCCGVDLPKDYRFCRRLRKVL
jgi:hypothetical protein